MQISDLFSSYNRDMSLKESGNVSRSAPMENAGSLSWGILQPGAVFEGVVSGQEC